jgi:hypothetical protein
MATGLRKFALTMGAVAAQTDAAAAAVSKAATGFGNVKPSAPPRSVEESNVELATIRRRIEELQREIDAAPAVVAARDAAKAIADRIEELEKKILAAGTKPSEALLIQMRALRAEQTKSDLVLADIQQEIDARFAALRDDEQRVKAGERLDPSRGEAAGGPAAAQAVGPFVAGVSQTLSKTREKIETVLDDIEGLTYETFRTLNATEFDIEDFVTKQREKIETLRDLGLGENLDAYAVGFERLRRGDISPQLRREFSLMLHQIRQTITTLGGTAGRTFNFAELEREINEMARNARDTARNTRLGRTSGVLGKERSKSGCEEGPSLSILRGSGALR